MNFKKVLLTLWGITLLSSCTSLTRNDYVFSAEPYTKYASKQCPILQEDLAILDLWDVSHVTVNCIGVKSQPVNHANVFTLYYGGNSRKPQNMTPKGYIWLKGGDAKVTDNYIRLFASTSGANTGVEIFNHPHDEHGVRFILLYEH